MPKASVRNPARPNQEIIRDESLQFFDEHCGHSRAGALTSERISMVRRQCWPPVGGQRAAAPWKQPERQLSRSPPQRPEHHPPLGPVPRTCLRSRTPQTPVVSRRYANSSSPAQRQERTSSISIPAAMNHRSPSRGQPGNSPSPPPMNRPPTPLSRLMNGHRNRSAAIHQLRRIGRSPTPFAQRALHPTPIRALSAQPTSARAGCKSPPVQPSPALSRTP